MNKFAKVTALTGAIVAAVLLTGAVANGTASASPPVTVTVSAAPNAAKVSDLLARLASGQNPRPSDKRTVTFVLDSTERYARYKKCGFDSRGNELSPEGHLNEAHLYGQTLDGIGTAKTRASARAKLSYFNGLCYFLTSGKDVAYPRNARQGAVRRVALALSKMTGTTIELRDSNGKLVGVYRWSNKW